MTGEELFQIKTKRQAFLDWCYAQRGKPYLWGKDGPEGFDCSGLVCAGILALGGPDWRQTHNSERMFREWKKIEGRSAQGGDLVFYGPPNRITHVMVLWPDGRVFGATGGNSKTTTPTKGAEVQFRSKVMYRPDLRGFRAFPLEDSNVTRPSSPVV
jgi:cell wall-associated NlpC family hydrolase